jgi:hypothetical protein
VLVARVALALVAAAVAAATIASPAQATFPGRNGSILLTEEHQAGYGGEGKLVAIDPKTGDQRTVWQCEGGAAPPQPFECDAITTPAVSPDGATAAVISLKDLFSSRTYDWSLHLIQVSSAKVQSVPLAAGFNFITDARGRTLRWTGDGTGLTAGLWTGVFTAPFVHRHLDLNGDLGASVGPADATDFDWSVDGRGAFINRSNLFVITPDGTRRRLTLRGAANPSWSPHGRWIAFTRGKQIWIVRSRGGQPRRLTSRGGERPAWSPDGRRLAFLRKRGGDAYLYILDPRGGPARRLVDETVEPLSYSSSFITSPPEWQALPR